MQVKHLIWLIPAVTYALWQSAHLAEWPVALQNLVHYAPMGIAGLGILISFFLNRIQPLMVFATLLVATLGFDFLYPGYAFGRAPELFYPLVSLWLPLTLLLWSVLPERGVNSVPYNLLMGLLLLAPMASLEWAMETLSLEWVDWITRSVSDQSDYWLQLPKMATFVILTVLLVMLLRLAVMRQSKVFDAVMVAVVFLSAYGLNAFFDPLVFDWMLTMSGILVLLSLIFDAHFIAYNDQLTGLNGRRALLESFAGLGRKYAIAMADIDHFKKFNDTYGHDIGDLALQQVASELAHVQGGGRIYRYGGEEFTLVFPRKMAAEALPFLQQLCESVAQTPLVFDHNGQKQSVKVTISIGVADRQHANTPEAVMKCADEALYTAKKAGRNQVKSYQKPSKDPKTGASSKSSSAKPSKKSAKP